MSAINVDIYTALTWCVENAWLVVGALAVASALYAKLILPKEIK